MDWKRNIKTFAFVLFLAFAQPLNSFAAKIQGSSATSSSYATEAAQELFAQGGNAVDAACGAAFVLNVTQGYFTGIGGSGFLTLYKPGVGSKTFDFRAVAPAQTSRKLFIGADGKPITS